MGDFIIDEVVNPSVSSYGSNTGLNNGNLSTPFQFVLGHVVEVILYSPWPDIDRINGTGIRPLYTNARPVNSIKAIKYDSDAVKVKNIKALSSEIYYPLMRGISDAPTQGDQVLLCKFGNVNYYLGPINTTNSPNYNVDHLFSHDNIESIIGTNSDNKLDSKYIYNLNPDFILQPNIRRMEKPVTDMDFKYSINDNPNPLTRGIGDLMLEGRFGNSIRIGSRVGYPKLIISNGRNPHNKVETLRDGGIIAMTSVGTLSDNFPDELFDLPSNDKIKKDKSSKIKRILEVDGEYNMPQMIISSDRVIFNSKSDSIFMSSHSNIEIGSGDKIKLYSNNETIIESKNIYLGEKAVDGEPIVLGNELVQLLKDMIGHIGKLYVAATIAGISSPIEAGGSPGWIQLMKLVNTMDSKILSKHHFIEPNGKK